MAEKTLAASYARWRARALGQITDRLEADTLLKLLGPVAHQRVLDVGCGDGAFAAALASRGAAVTAIDSDPSMVTAARERAARSSPSFTVASGYAEALPCADGTFDAVVAVTVLCFVSEADRAVAEMARVLRPGGRLVIGDLGRWSLWAASRRIRGWTGASIWRNVRFRTGGELRRLLERHELSPTQTLGAIFYPPNERAAVLMERLDPWLGRLTTVGAAFIAAVGVKDEALSCLEPRVGRRRSHDP